MIRMFLALISSLLLAQEDPKSLFNLSGQWTNSAAKKIELKSLKGQPFVIAMIYMTCPEACPMTVANMKGLEKDLIQKKRKDVKFILVSFDPETDTPEKMRGFAEKHKLDMKKWTLLTGEPENLRELAAALGVTYEKVDKKDFSHNQMYTAVDEKGVILGQSEDQNKIIGFFVR